LKSFLWVVGRSLQVIALLQAGAALLIGFQTSDPTLELKLLLMSVLEFMVGYAIVTRVGRSA
jgi:hypothetical protein